MSDYNLERGAGKGDRGREVWERVLSGNLDKNPKWPIGGNKQHQGLDNT